MEHPVYHVLHEGRRLGPFDRRTIVGMRVKKALNSKDMLLGADGAQLTVGELVRQGQPQDGSFEASSLQAPITGDGSHAVVQGIHAGQLLEVEGKGHDIPAFQGEIEVRVQTRVLRISGRFREGLAWREDRVKFPLQDIAHARLRGTVVDLWVRTTEDRRMQRVSLDLLKAQAAGELAESLPYTAPYPGSEPLAGRSPGAGASLRPLMWTAIVGSVVGTVGMLVWALTRH